MVSIPFPPLSYSVFFFFFLQNLASRSIPTETKKARFSVLFVSTAMLNETEQPLFIDTIKQY